jgi:hypothetical protein
MPEDETRSQKFGKVGADYRQRLIESMADRYGGKASEAVALSPDEELAQYRKPTSMAAQIVLQRGGSIEEAEQANALEAQHLKQQQFMMRSQLQQSGATADQMLKALTDAQLTDDAIFRTTRAMAWELAKANGKNDIAEETRYHETMVKKLQEHRAKTAQPTYEPVQQPDQTRTQEVPGASIL